MRGRVEVFLKVEITILKQKYSPGPLFLENTDWWDWAGFGAKNMLDYGIGQHRKFFLYFSINFEAFRCAGLKILNRISRLALVDRLKPILKLRKNPTTRGQTFSQLNHVRSSSNFQDFFQIIYQHNLWHHRWHQPSSLQSGTFNFLQCPILIGLNWSLHLEKTPTHPYPTHPPGWNFYSCQIFVKL